MLSSEQYAKVLKYSISLGKLASEQIGLPRALVTIYLRNIVTVRHLLIVV